MIAIYYWECLLDEGCTNQVRKGGATAIGKDETFIQTIKGCETTVERIPDAQGGEIDARDRQANAGRAAVSRESSSFLSPVMT